MIWQIAAEEAKCGGKTKSHPDDSEESEEEEEESESEDEESSSDEYEEKVSLSLIKGIRMEEVDLLTKAF